MMSRCRSAATSPYPEPLLPQIVNLLSADPYGLSESAQDPGPPARGSPRDLAIGIDAGEIDGPVWSVSGRGTTGAFRSSHRGRGAQVLPPAGATVPPWLPAKSARVSNLPACCALGPADPEQDVDARVAMASSERGNQGQAAANQWARASRKGHRCPYRCPRIRPQWSRASRKVFGHRCPRIRRRWSLRPQWARA